MQFLAEFPTLSIIIEYIKREAYKSGMQEKTLNKMELACEEAIVNIISYAYPKKRGVLDIVCITKGHRFEITLRDQGVPFNPIEAEINPQIDASIQDREIGGLGIYLLRQTIDEASYQRLEDENILRLAFLIQ